jgi:hypothetical protein
MFNSLIVKKEFNTIHEFLDVDSDDVDSDGVD